MREIKFEFVSKHDDEKTFHKQVYTLDEIMYTLPEYVYEGHPMKQYTIIAKREYTGIKDKNGVEIYEGDILEHDCNSEIFIGFVEFKEGCFGVYDKEKHFDSWVFDYDWKVIGNIYENHELLDEK